MDSSPRSVNNKFVKSGRKSQSKSREKILVNSVKGKELYMHQYKKHHRSCPNSMIDSVEFFLFTAVFLQPFALFSFLCFFFCPLSLNPFSCYILWFLDHFLHPYVSQVLRVFFVPSHPSLNLLLLAVRLLVYCSGITSTLMRPESQLGSI